jgi:hypothetical protein
MMNRERAWAIAAQLSAQPLSNSLRNLGVLCASAVKAVGLTA